MHIQTNKVHKHIDTHTTNKEHKHIDTHTDKQRTKPHGHTYRQTKNTNTLTHIQTNKEQASLSSVAEMSRLPPDQCIGVACVSQSPHLYSPVCPEQL
jgi:hypothetical protein